MINNSVIIASTAGCLICLLGRILNEFNYKIYSANDDVDLYSKINSTFPKLIFIEHCFLGHKTDAYIYKLMRFNQNLHIVIWTAAQLNPSVSARFIHAGAESFISLRESEENIKKIIRSIAEGRRYCPKEIEEIIEKEFTLPIIGKEYTKREIEIIKLLYKGYTNIEIANTLSISKNTVRFHKKNIYRKISGIKNTDILINGLKNKIIFGDENE